MRVKTKRAMAYGRRQYAAGAELDMSERDARLMQAVGRVVPVDDVPPVQVAQAEARAEASRDEAAQDEAKRKGKYKRRDMQAEEPGEDTSGET